VKIKVGGYFFSKQIQIHPMDILGITMADTIFRGKKREDVQG